MITEDKRFIEIQGILAFSDIHPSDCIKINDLIIELSKENTQLKERIEKAKEIINQMIFNGYAKDGTYYMATSEKSEFGVRAKVIKEILKGDKE